MYHGKFEAGDRVIVTKGIDAGRKASVEEVDPLTHLSYPHYEVRLDDFVTFLYRDGPEFHVQGARSCVRHSDLRLLNALERLAEEV